MSEEPDAAVYDAVPGSVEAPQPPQQTEFPDDSEYGSFDPQVVQPHSSRPAPSSTAPGDVGSTTGADGDLPTFDPRVTKEFEGLLYLGALTSKFSYLGHTFVIRTLRTGELIETALLSKEYVGTTGETKAYEAAIVAACVVSVDGKELPVPITDTPGDTVVRNKFDYVMAHWFPPVLDYVYQKYFLLEMTVMRVMEAMGNQAG